jgi:hypothetical protein
LLHVARVYRAVAWQRVVQIRYNILKTAFATPAFIPSSRQEISVPDIDELCNPDYLDN